MSVLSKQLRNDSVSRMDAIELRETQLNQRADALDQRERNLGVLAAQVTDFVGKASVLFDRLHKMKADQDEPEELPLPPGHMSEEPDPALGTDAELPGEPSACDPGDPNVPGDFPRLNRPIQRDQEDPPVGGVEFPTEPLPNPPEVQQPVGDKE